MKPIVIASANGHQFRNGGPETCVERAFRLITEGADVLDAIVEGVTIVELDPGETSVGLGSLPNADGVLELDACCMHGPRRRAGGVAALQGVATTAAVARRVLLDTPHHLLAGFEARDLMTPTSRAIWHEWKRRLDTRLGDRVAAAPSHERMRIGYAISLEMSLEGLIDANHLWGTISCSAVGSRGDICGVTTTSGLAFKIPGRIGDSPILGAGLYARHDVGAAGSTGRGESNLYSVSSFAVVHAMRQGMSPKDACMAALREIQHATVDAELLNTRGLPAFNVKLYAVNAAGECAGAALYGGDEVQYAVCTENGGELRTCEALIDKGHEFVD
jgi:N4-(beta-N-acetylglucosaminyl)-L-asparaginase